jgi:DNA (cytosine-5)-methyltransferase 1
MSVELWRGMFVRITQVVDNRQGFFLRGQHFTTLESLGEQFPKWERELCWVVRETTDGTEILEEDIPIAEVKGIQTIHLTNRRYTTGENSSDYFCRLKRASVSRTDIIIRYLMPEEADEGFKVPLNVLRWSWRGETRAFGSIDNCSPPTVIDIETGRPLALSAESIRQYTFGDSFCGAGGVSCGARRAGLFVKWGFDHSIPPLSTFAKNFTDATCELADFDQFMTISSNEVRVDVCHSSPPCQTWSPAHTIPSANDDKNSALIFSAFNLIGKVKPRIHTMEETTGLIERHKDEFNCVVRDIIELGYSIHCKVVNCYDYGVPQIRKRLILIAAG